MYTDGGTGDDVPASVFVRSCIDSLCSILYDESCTALLQHSDADEHCDADARPILLVLVLVLVLVLLLLVVLVLVLVLQPMTSQYLTDPLKGRCF